ncbi:thiolase domain-containing protein [Sulfurisphaera javensis]|uniref:Thiolase domain-containing protein n=1 Tax=Sulfurisphaera javensis TaxID=2049879 RepID=A0AAT9GPK7_9CREN
MNRKVAVIGVGNSKFGKRDDVTIRELAWEAVKEALEDAGLTQKDINITVIGSTAYRGTEIYPAPPVSEYCGFVGKSPIRVEAACATGSSAAFTAINLIASGLADIVMAIGVDKMTEVDTATSLAIGGRGGNYYWEFQLYGTTFPTYYALYATRHMAVFGTTEEDMALASVKAHKYASLNEKAHFRNRITVEDVLKSRVISWPIKLLDSSPISDGSAAVIFASEEKVKELKIDTPIWVKGIGYSSDTSYIAARGEWIGLEAARDAAVKAYKMAKVSPMDIEYATVHDCFSIAEIMAYEDLGFVDKGKGAELLREGQTEKDGRVAVNLFGGLKAKGHPLGATGLSMIYEITKQLREEAGPVQHSFKRYLALTHNVGGTGHYAYVMIFNR